MKPLLSALTVTILLALPWPGHGVSFRFAASSNRIYVEDGGTATLTAIKNALPNAPLDLVNSNGRIWLLRANLQIEDGSVVVLRGTAVGGDVNELRLLSNDGSALTNVVSITADYGTLTMENTKITSWKTSANGPDLEYETFGRAYVRVRSSLAADGVTPLESRMDIRNSEIMYLGYDAAESYGLSWKVNGTHPDPTKSIFDFVNVYGDIIGNHIHHNYWGIYSFGLEGGQWLNNEINNNAGYGFDPHDDSDNLRIEGNNVHHNGGIGRGTHGIIASMNCDHLIIRNNRSWANAENGIMVHRHADDCIIENNQTYLNGDSGIAIFDSDRTIVRNNIILSNSNAGIRLSVGSTDNVIVNNEIGYSGVNGILFVPGTDPPEPDPVDPTLSNRNRRNTVATNSIHHCTAEGVKMVDGDNNLFFRNTFSANGPEIGFETSRSTRFISNTIPANVTVDLSGSSAFPTSVQFKRQPLVVLALANTSSSATFEDDAGAVFDFNQTTVSTRVTNQHSFVTLTTTLIGSGTTVVTRNLFVSLNSGEVQVNPSLWESTGQLRKQWSSQATAASATIQYTVGDLAPNTSYAVQKNGAVLTTLTSDAAGRVSFSDTPGTTSAVQFAVAASGTPPTLPTVTVAATDASASETAPNTGTFTVSRIGGSTNALTVRYSMSGTASNGTDYSTLSGSVSIAAGSLSATVTVSPINDTAPESSETAVLTLSSDAAYTVGSPNSATVTIADNDQSTTLPTVTVTATDATASETAPNNGTFTISRTGATTNALTVSYSAGGTATSGSDYSALSGSISIPIGSSSATVTVSPVNDTLVETNETVILTLSSNAAYTIGAPNSATVTITDNDQSPGLPTVTVMATDANASETAPNTGTFTISRTGATTNALTVSYSVGGSAGSGDYTALAGSVSIPIGSASATVTVSPVDDALVETNETVVLMLSASASYVVGTPNTATVTIVDNDQSAGLPTVTVAATDASASETAPNTGAFTISRTGATTNTLTVLYSLGGSASNGVDYAALAGSVTIPIGSASVALTVSPVDDLLLEANETAVLTLSANAAYALGSPSSATVNIADNDLPTNLASVTVEATDASAAEAGPDPGAFTVYRTGETTNDLTVEYSLSGSALNGVDYAALFGTVTIPTGSASAVITLTPSDDILVEGSQAAVFTLTADPAYVVGSPNNATVTIADNDVNAGPVVVTVSASDSAAVEGERISGSFTFSRTGDNTADLRVSFLVGGTAVNGTDYTSLSGSVDINGGKSSTKVYVTPLNDAIAEGIENIVVSLSAGPGYTVASASSATVTIADSTQTAGPVVVGVVASDPIASELGSEPGTFTFFRMGGSDRPLALRYTISGTASNGGDYTSLSGSVNFGRRKTSATVSVRPIVDATREGAENVVLALAPSPNYTIGSFGIATVSILDNPNPVLGAAGSQGPTLTVPVLTAAGQGNGELAISWDCLAGQRYQLQYRSGWNATPWTDLGGVIITPEDATVIIPDLIGAEAQRSYRVVLLPLDAQ